MIRIIYRTVSDLSQLIVQTLDIGHENSTKTYDSVWGLGTTYDVQLELIRKRVMDLVLIKRFWLEVTAEALPAKLDWKTAISLQRGQFDPKFHVERVAPTNHAFSQKARLNGLAWCKNLPFFLRFTRLTDGRTDTFLATRSPCIQCSADCAVKILKPSHRMHLFPHKSWRPFLVFQPGH